MPLSNEPPLMEAREVTVRFGGLLALEEASIEVEQGKVTALIGPNGAGKSTLLHVISGFQRPTRGDVLLRGESIVGQSPHALVRRGLARSFQDLEVFGLLTVAENLALALPNQVSESMFRLMTQPAAVRRERREVIEAVGAILERLGIEEYADELAGNLSYGVQKQVILGRLLATGAELLMFDEPGAGLPRAATENLGTLLRTVVAEEGKSVLLVDHNMDLVLQFADYVYVLHAGRVIVAGTPQEIRDNEQVADVYLSRDHLRASEKAAALEGELNR